MSKEFNEIIIGTHNSMSFLKPKHWWMRPINWLFAQCQNNENAVFDGGCVDIRIYWDNDVWRFAHGLVSYEFDDKYQNNIYQTISTLKKSAVHYFRIILERDGNEEGFAKLCERLEYKYDGEDVTFIGGYRKSDWKQLYDFGTNDIPIHQWVGSMADDARWYEKFMPRLYAKRMNIHNLKNAKKGINLYDFIYG